MDIFINILIYAGIVQGFYMAILVNHNKKKNVANTYFAVLLIALSLSIVHTEFVVPEIHQTNNAFRIKEPFLMLIMPLIWLYVRKLEQPLFRFKLKTAVHFFPFAAFMLLSIPAVIINSNTPYVQFLANHILLINGIFCFIVMVQYSVYLFQIVRISHAYKFKAGQELSNIEHFDLSWLNAFLYAFILVFALLAFMFVGSIHNLNINWLNKIISLVFTATIFVLGFKGLFQQSIFSNTNDLGISESISPEIQTNRRSDETLKNRVQEFMEKEKPYCDQDLTLTSLATHMNLSRNQLSEIINNNFGCNFYDFVNKYRVEEVKQLLNHPHSKDFTLLAIAFDAGFPSKSTFNSIFKKFTGLTPSEYRNRLL